MIQIGILAIQGAFVEHQKVLEKLGAKCFEIRKSDDLCKKMDGLILPGGESTVMSKLLKELNLFDPMLGMISKGLPVMGTCAGSILLAKNVIGGETHFSTFPMTIQRNAYGRQLSSFETRSEFDGNRDTPMIFIRAPVIVNIENDVEVLAYVDDVPVAVRYKNQMAISFHPELSDDIAVHSYFLNMVQTCQ
jgi:pyridoxal 5''-phosphate synthase, glutaminase subunit Pdx2